MKCTWFSFSFCRFTYIKKHRLHGDQQSSNNEYIWLDTVYKPLFYILLNIVSFDTVEFDLDEIIALTKIFSNIIDFRNPFTATHSAGMAKTAEKSAELAGFSENECKMMLIADHGCFRYFHRDYRDRPYRKTLVLVDFFKSYNYTPTKIVSTKIGQLLK